MEREDEAPQRGEAGLSRGMRSRAAEGVSLKPLAARLTSCFTFKQPLCLDCPVRFKLHV